MRSRCEIERALVGLLAVLLFGFAVATPAAAGLAGLFGISWRWLCRK